MKRSKTRVYQSKKTRQQSEVQMNYSFISNVRKA